MRASPNWSISSEIQTLKKERDSTIHLLEKLTRAATHRQLITSVPLVSLLLTCRTTRKYFHKLHLDQATTTSKTIKSHLRINEKTRKTLSRLYFLRTDRKISSCRRHQRKSEDWRARANENSRQRKKKSSQTRLRSQILAAPREQRRRR